MKSLNVLITAAVAALAACDTNPTEPASADLDLAAVTTASGAHNEEIDREVWDYYDDWTDREWFYDCEGERSERIRMEGGVWYRLVFFTDGSGGEHVLFQRRTDNVRGVGLHSGEAFRLQWIEHWADSYSRTISSGWTTRMTFVARESGRGFQYTGRGRYTYANGEVIRDVVDESYTCSL
jgi:hypothetical protein